MDYQTGEQLTRAKYTIQTMKNFISAKFTFIIMNCEKSMPEVVYEVFRKQTVFRIRFRIIWNVVLTGFHSK